MNVAAASGVTTITGGSGADTLRGDASSTISGGAGIDTIVGGSGNDTLNGGDGNDLITTGAGIDAVDGGAGDDTFTVVGNITATDTFEGGTGTDTISLNNASLTTLNALTVSEANTFNAGFNNVEKLTISDALNQTSFDIGYLDSLNHVTVTTQTGAETLNGFDSGDTIELTTTKAGVLTTGVNNASTGTTDVLNVLLTDGTGNAEDFGDIAIANVETINVTTREATADASDSASTLGIAVTQVTDGAAQTVNFFGTESVVIDTAIAAGTVDASGLTITAATDNGFTMDSTVHTAAQTITGSGGVDVLYGSTKGDTINGGAGADTIHGGTGGDTIDGGAGTDTYHTTSMVGATIEGTGTGTSTGVVINLGTTAVTGATINSATTEFISGSLTSVAAGQAVYLFGAESSLNTSAADTISNVENVTLAGNGINYVVGSAAANTVVGGTGVDVIIAGGGADIITGGTGLDTITLGTSGDVDTVFFTATTDGGAAGTDSTGDTITGFVSTEDKISLDGALATALDDVTDDSTLAFATTGINDGDTTAAVAATISATNEMLFLDTDNSGLVAADLGDISDVATALEAQITLTSANTNDALVVVEASDTAGTFGVYLFVETTTNTNQFDTAELTLLGIVTADDVVAADFITT